VTRCDLPRRGKLRRVWRHRGRRAPTPSLRAKGKGRPETWRTPWPDAGCNKPAGCRAEQTAVVGKNGKGGTRPECGSSGPKGGPRPAWERTLGICTGGGAIFDEPQERSPERGRQSLRAQPEAGRTARTDMSLRRSGNSSVRSRPGAPEALAAKANHPRCLRRRRQHASTSVGAVEALSSQAEPTSREAVQSRKGEDLTVRCARL
jgi:hypothetical protein